MSNEFKGNNDYSQKVLADVSRDWETGYSDYWEYKLIPYNEER